MSEDLILVLMLCTVFFSCCFGTYVLGRKLGHDKAYKELYDELADQTQTIYLQGLHDGQKL